MQISQRVHALKVPFTITIPPRIIIERSVYVYLIYGAEVCLIDSGVAGAEQMVFDYLRKTGRKVSDIGLIAQTHSHPDHIGATRTIKAETGCAVAVHPAEKAWIEDVELQERERPVPGFQSLVSGRVAVNRVLIDGELIDLGCGLKLKVIHTPGHSPGSVSFLLLGFNELFSGDTVPVPGELPVYEDVSALVQSIKKLQAIPDIQHLLASWGEPRKKEEAYQGMDEGLRYLQQIHEAVLKVCEDRPDPDPMTLCKAVLPELGIDPVVANPILARSFVSHLSHRNQRKLI